MDDFVGSRVGIQTSSEITLQNNLSDYQANNGAQSPLSNNKVLCALTRRFSIRAPRESLRRGEAHKTTSPWDEVHKPPPLKQVHCPRTDSKHR